MLMKKMICLILISMALCSCVQSRAQEKPNVIIIMTDDQGWGDLGVTGNSNLSTPSIDKLAGGGGCHGQRT